MTNDIKILNRVLEGGLRFNDKTNIMSRGTTDHIEVDFFGNSLYVSKHKDGHYVSSFSQNGEGTAHPMKDNEEMRKLSKKVYEFLTKTSQEQRQQKLEQAKQRMVNSIDNKTTKENFFTRLLNKLI